MSRLITKTELNTAYAAYVASNMRPTYSAAQRTTELDRKVARTNPVLDAYAEYERIARRTPVAR